MVMVYKYCIFNSEVIIYYIEQQISRSMLKILAFLIIIVSTSSNIVITSPLVNNFQNNQIPYYYANFGQISYGKTLSLDLLVLNDSLCDTNLEFQHLKKPTYIVIKTNFMQTCSYTKRALFAQSIGAKGLIIASDIALYQTNNVIQADDGNGKKVHISCFFILPSSFDKLSKLSKIQIIAKFPVPQQKISTLTLFLSASKRSTYVFLRELKNQYSHLKNNLKIDLIYETVNCAYCGHQNCYVVGYNPQNPQTYCAFDYSNQQLNVGQKIIVEQLNQYNIFLENGVSKWLGYMDLFDKNCDDWNNVERCSQNIKNKLKITSNNIYNHLEQLTQWRIKQVKLGFDRFPEVAINNMVYEGNLNVDQIFATVCESLLEPPKYCLNQEIQDEPPKNNNLMIVIMSSIISLIIFTILGIFIYKRLIKTEMTRDMASRVDELVANYANSVTSSKKRKREKLVETFDQQI